MPADAAKSSEESRMSMAAVFNYVYGGDIVDLTAPASSWFFEPGETPPPDRVLQVANAFGIDGEVREVPADMGGGWAVGADDYSEPSVTVGADGTLGWWYNPGGAGQSVSSSCELIDPAPPIGDLPDDQQPAEETVSDGVPLTTVAADMICAEPTPPTNVPSVGEAESKATELLAALGLLAQDYDLETYADDWGANVTAFLRLDGIRTPLSINVGYGAEGAITWAGGFLATPRRGADYPRIGIEAAVQRLNDQNLGWMYGTIGTGFAEVVAADGSTGVVTGSAPDGAPDAPIETVGQSPPAETITPPELEPVTVTLTNARPSLEMLWAADSTVWLLPGYAFDGADHGQFSVIAVEDQYIDVAAAPEGVPEPMPPVSIDTAIPPTQPDGSIGTVVPLECPAIGEPPAAVPGDTQSPIASEDGAGWIGLCVADAAAVAEQEGFQIRVVRIDGVDQAVTMDFVDSRFNVAVDNGIVTAIVSIG